MNPIAFLFMIIAAAGLTPLLYAAISSQGEQEQATVAAMQMARINKAAQGYITANAAAVEANSTATSPAVITVPMLVNTGYLPNGFNANNPYGQVWEVQVLQPAANQLQALVVSQGGQTVDAKQAGMVAQEAGGTGGVIGGGTGKFAVPGCNAGAACGVYAGWDVSTNGYQNVAPGHLAALIEYSNGQLQSDYLYRTAVPGQPQLNTMQTNLNMGANNINNAQNVNVNQDVTLGNPSAATGGSAGSSPGQLGVDEPAGQGLPSGWGGGIHTWDLYANGTVAAGWNGSQGAYMSDFSGGAYGGGQVGTSSPNTANYTYMQANNGGSSIGTNGTVQGGTVNSTGDMNANGNVSANNVVSAGNEFSTYNGSWWANNAGDSSQSGTATANKVYTNNDVRFQQTGYSAGGSCTGVAVVNGYANGNAGQLLDCQNGQWQAMGGQWLQSGSPFWEAFDPVGNMTARFCAISSLYVGGSGGGASVNPVSGPNGAGQYVWSFGDTGDTSYWGACYN